MKKFIWIYMIGTCLFIGCLFRYGINYSDQLFYRMHMKLLVPEKSLDVKKDLCTKHVCTIEDDGYVLCHGVFSNQSMEFEVYRALSAYPDVQIVSVHRSYF